MSHASLLPACTGAAPPSMTNDAPQSGPSTARNTKLLGGGSTTSKRWRSTVVASVLGSIFVLAISAANVASLEAEKRARHRRPPRIRSRIRPWRKEHQQDPGCREDAR